MVYYLTHKRMRKLIFCIVTVLFASTCKKENSVLPGQVKDEKTQTSSPADFLSSANYDKLIVQIVYEAGSPPAQTAVINLTSFLQQRLNKPSGIQILQQSISPQGKTVLSLDDIKALEKTNRAANTAERVLTAYIFFANGDYDQNSGNKKVLGIAYGFSSIVIFDKTIHDVSGGLGQPSISSVETSVVEHEFGHVMGLVNNGVAMASPHQDEANGRHCNNKDCLMYYATETSDMIANLVNSNVPTLDANCLNDLKAAGGK